MRLLVEADHRVQLGLVDALLYSAEQRLLDGGTLGVLVVLAAPPNNDARIACDFVLGVERIEAVAELFHLLARELFKQQLHVGSLAVRIVLLYVPKLAA